MKHFAWILQQARGRYIAFVEGDDFWTDPLKLAKQKQQLDNNPDYALVFSNTSILSDSGMKHEDLHMTRIPVNRIYSAVEVLEKWTIPFNTAMFRNILDSQFFSHILANRNFLFGDIVLILWLAKKGRLFGMADDTAVYRRHDHNITSAHYEDYFGKLKHLSQLTETFGEEYVTPVILHYISGLESCYLSIQHSSATYMQKLQYYLWKFETPIALHLLNVFLIIS